MAAAWQARLYYQLALLASAQAAQTLPLRGPGARTRSLDSHLCAPNPTLPLAPCTFALNLPSGAYALPAVTATGVQPGLSHVRHASPPRTFALNHFPAGVYALPAVTA